MVTSQMAILASSFVLLTRLFLASAYTENTYTAAVYEHARRGTWSTDSAKDIVATNLEFFKRAATTAKSKGADIIVFPEYGIFPLAERTAMKEILEFLPDPKLVSTNPCEEAAEYSDRPILQTLSCIARDNAMVVVANTGSIRPCGNATNCRDDGDLHFNTNAAFDSDGTLIGRYDKEHLFLEGSMDLPEHEQDPTFQTKFGKFATFICFDIVFKKITYFAKTDVDAILLPCNWPNPSPRGTSLPAWNSFAMENNITLMAANIHMPGKFSVGSGIFNAKNGQPVYTFNPDGLSKLVVATVPRRNYKADISEFSITAITANGTEEYENDGDKVPMSCSTKLLGKSTDIYTDYRCFGEDTSNFTFTKLEQTKGRVEACNRGICCDLEYEANDMKESYYLGVYNGTYSAVNRYFWCEEKCMLLRCDPLENNPCAIFPLRSQTKFQRVHLTANITEEYTYPLVVGSGIRLVPTTDWSYGSQLNKTFITFENKYGSELLVVGLNGRCYDRDPPYAKK